MACIVGVGAVALLTGAVVVWSFVHTVQVIIETQRVIRSRPIDFDPSYLGLPVEQAIPLGVLFGGVALVALVHLIRLVNNWRAAQAAA